MYAYYFEHQNNSPEKFSSDQTQDFERVNCIMSGVTWGDRWPFTMDCCAYSSFILLIGFVLKIMAGFLGTLRALNFLLICKTMIIRWIYGVLAVCLQEW